MIAWIVEAWKWKPRGFRGSNDEKSPPISAPDSSPPRFKTRTRLIRSEAPDNPPPIVSPSRGRFADDRTILELSLPSIGTGLITISYIWIDTYFIGRMENAYLAESGVAALTVSWFSVWIFGSIISLNEVGLTALVGRYVGAGKRSAAAYAGGQGLRLCLVLYVPVAILGWLAAPWVFAVANSDPIVSTEGSAYVRMYFLGGFATLVQRSAVAVFRGHGNTFLPFIVAVGGLILNAILNPIFIYGRGYFDGMGVSGAALATVLAQAASCLLTVPLLSRQRWIDSTKPPDEELRLTPTTPLHHPRALGLDFNIFVRVTRVGIPVSVSGVLFSLIYIWMTGIVDEAGGTAAVAGLGVGLRGEAVAFLICSGYSVAASSLVSRRLGAGDPDGAQRFAWRCVAHCALGCGAWAIVLFTMDDTIAALLIPNEGAAQEYSKSFFRIIAVCLVPLAFEVVLEGAFGGAGLTIPPMIVTVFLTLIRIPLAIWVVRSLHAGAEGIWWVISLTAIARAVVLAIWFSRGTWKTRSV